jgi:hypothetical protein
MPDEGLPQIRYVGSFEQLALTPFGGGVNALCWRRPLVGDFGEVAALFRDEPGVESLDEGVLREPSLSAAGDAAVDFMLNDVRLLRERGLHPELNYISEYPRDEAAAIVNTDVYSFHVDRAPIEVDTWLCTYYGAPSEGLSNEHAVRRVDVDATRSALLRDYRGSDAAGFDEYLREHNYDLHYVPVAGATPWTFGVGHLWRIATAWPGARVPPCIHRAPGSGSARLLLIS